MEARQAKKDISMDEARLFAQKTIRSPFMLIINSFASIAFIWGGFTRHFIVAIISLSWLAAVGIYIKLMVRHIRSKNRKE
jgi:hypothetical protein